MALVTLLVLIAGCGPARPDDQVRLVIYTRNLSPNVYSFTMTGSEPPTLGQLGGAEPRSYGCGWVAPDWRLIVTEGQARPDAAGDFVAVATAQDFVSRDPVVMWISADARGEVQVGEGLPAWWAADVQRC